MIRGEENLPGGGGHIVVMDHLVNHIDNAFPNGFAFTLDTHFVSALLCRRYGQAPVRVIRASDAGSTPIGAATTRLGYIYVSSRVPDEESACVIDPTEFDYQVSTTLAA